MPLPSVCLVTRLEPGVTPQAFTRGTQFGAANSSRSQYVTVEGGRDSSTNYAIDGVYVRSLRFNNISLNPPLDVVQEVTVLRNSFSTEYGQGQAVVSIITKSGTNALAGSAYEFLRNDKLNSKNYFDTTKPPYKRNQYGATVGGPPADDRTGPNLRPLPCEGRGDRGGCLSPLSASGRG